jgi:NSS family neurotransmitter:Na+ symporter
MPLLTVMFVILVVQSLFLPGAMEGLNAFFTPNWEALADPAVWASAYGHIFFSLSVAFGIMVTYASYLKRKTDLTGSGLVVAFANSGFEILAGIGVFAALGFMAQAQANGRRGGRDIRHRPRVHRLPDDRLAGDRWFDHRRAVLRRAGLRRHHLAHLGARGVVAALQDKLGWTRIRTTLTVSIPLAIVSIALFSTTTALAVLDTTDAFVNAFGIMAVALVAVVVVAWLLHKLPVLQAHLNERSSFRIGLVWKVLVAGLAPVVLGYLFVTELIAKISEPYSGYPGWFLAVFGWGMVSRSSSSRSCCRSCRGAAARVRRTTPSTTSSSPTSTTTRTPRPTPCAWSIDRRVENADDTDSHRHDDHRPRHRLGRPHRRHHQPRPSPRGDGAAAARRTLGV